MTDQIVLGSGNVYIMGFDGEVPAAELIETEENRVGYIQGGASLQYSPTELQISDDTGTFTRRYLTKEEVTFKSGVMTWTLNILNQLSCAGRYTEANGIRTLKLGGAGAREMKKLLIHFVHTKDDGNTIKITIAGTASNGFTLAFAPDKETVIDAEFKAITQDKDGTLVVVTESFTQETPPVVTPENPGEVTE